MVVAVAAVAILRPMQGAVAVAVLGRLVKVVQPGQQLMDFQVGQLSKVRQKPQAVKVWQVAGVLARQVAQIRQVVTQNTAVAEVGLEITEPFLLKVEAPCLGAVVEAEV